MTIISVSDARVLWKAVGEELRSPIPRASPTHACRKLTQMPNSDLGHLILSVLITRNRAFNKEKIIYILFSIYGE